MVKKFSSLITLLGLFLAPTHSHTAYLSSKDACYLGVMTLSVGLTAGTVYTLYQDRQKYDRKEKEFITKLEKEKSDYAAALENETAEFNKTLDSQQDRFNKNQDAIIKQAQELQSKFESEISTLRTSSQEQLQTVKDGYTARETATVAFHARSTNAFLESIAKFEKTAAKFLEKEAVFAKALEGQQTTFQSDLQELKAQQAQQNQEHETALAALKQAHAKHVKERVAQFTLATLLACAHIRAPEEQQNTLRFNLELLKTKFDDINGILTKNSLSPFAAEDSDDITSLAAAVTGDSAKKTLEAFTRYKQQLPTALKDALAGNKE